MPRLQAWLNWSTADFLKFKSQGKMYGGVSRTLTVNRGARRYFAIIGKGEIRYADT